MLILAGVFGDASTHEGLPAAIVVLRNKLMRFYSIYEQSHTGEVLTRVSDLVPSMLGEWNDQKLKTQGAETWGVCLFWISELEQNHAFRDSDDCMRALHSGQLLELIVRTWKAHSWVMPASAVKDLGHSSLC